MNTLISQPIGATIPASSRWQAHNEVAERVPHYHDRYVEDSVFEKSFISAAVSIQIRISTNRCP